MQVKPVMWSKARNDGKHNIKIYVHLKGKRKYITTDVYVEAQFWDKGRNKIKSKHPLASKYNTYLRAKIIEIESSIIDHNDLRKLTSNNLLLSAFTAQYIDEAKSGLHNLTKGTIKNYSSFYLRICQYEKKYGRVGFNDVDLVFYDQFKSFLMNEKENGLAGFSKHIKILKKLMKVAEERKLHTNKDYIKFKRFRSPPGNKIYLSDTDIEQLEKLNLDQFKVMDFERDRFLLSYYFLMRYEDSTRINKDMLIEMTGRPYIRYKQGKTNTICIVPVSHKAMRLLNKHNFDFSSSINYTANRNIKKIASLAGINQKVMQGTQSMPKWYFVSTHTARRSAATNLALSGASLKIIADLGGWKDLDTLRIYLRSSVIDTAVIASDLDFFN